MKLFLQRKWWLLLLLPVFSKNVCGRHDVIDMMPPLGEQYATWQSNGLLGYLTTPGDNVSFARNGSLNEVSANSTNNLRQFRLSFDGPQTAGTYNSNSFSLVLNGRYYVQSGAPLQVMVTQYGTQGQYITGSYSGNLKDSTGNTTIFFNGEFKVKRP